MNHARLVCNQREKFQCAECRKLTSSGYQLIGEDETKFVCKGCYVNCRNRYPSMGDSIFFRQTLYSRVTTILSKVHRRMRTKTRTMTLVTSENLSPMVTVDGESLRRMKSEPCSLANPLQQAPLKTTRMKWTSGAH